MFPTLILEERFADLSPYIPADNFSKMVCCSEVPVLASLDGCGTEFLDPVSWPGKQDKNDMRLYYILRWTFGLEAWKMLCSVKCWSTVIRNCEIRAVVHRL